MKPGKILSVLLIVTICLSPCLYLHIPVARKDPELMQALLMFWLSCLALISCVFYPKDFRINEAELAFLGFYLFCIAKGLFWGRQDYAGFFETLFFIGLYIAIKRHLLRCPRLGMTCFLWSISLMVIIQLLLYWRCCYLSELFSPLYLPNTSLFGVLLSAQLAFLFGTVYSPGFNAGAVGTKRLFFFTSLVLAAVLLLALSKGRSGWLGLAAALLWLNDRFARPGRRFAVSVFAGIMMFAALLAGLVAAKADSSSGRILIYKISLRLLGEYWLWGTGQGRFASEYDLYQSRYFESRGIDNRESLLADNVYYAFNDLLQLLIENGVIGSSLFLLAIFVFVNKLRRLLTDGEKPRVVPFLAMLIGVSVSSFFIYSFHHLPVLLLVVVSLAFCNSSLDSKEWVVSVRVAAFSVCLQGLLATGMVIYTGNLVLYRRKASAAREWASAGLNRKAISLYRELEDSWVADGKILFEYARLLYQSGELSKAAGVITKAKCSFISNELFLLMGRVQQERANYVAAESNYRTALYMIPNRMRPRYDLMNLYMERKDSLKAVYWANSILHMPVKVWSKKVDLMRKGAFTVLQRSTVTVK